MADARIENQRQLEALKARFDQIQGAIGLQQIVQQQLEQQIRSYLENVAVVAGIEIDQGDKVTVDWSSGEVNVEHPQPGLLGVSELPVMNGVAHE